MRHRLGVLREGVITALKSEAQLLDALQRLLGFEARLCRLTVFLSKITMLLPAASADNFSWQHSKTSGEQETKWSRMDRISSRQQQGLDPPIPAHRFERQKSTNTKIKSTTRKKVGPPHLPAPVENYVELEETNTWYKGGQEGQNRQETKMLQTTSRCLDQGRKSYHGPHDVCALRASRLPYIMVLLTAPCL